MPIHFLMDLGCVWKKVSGNGMRVLLVSHVSPDSIYGAGSSLRQHMQLVGAHQLALFSPIHKAVKSVDDDVAVTRIFSPVTYNNDAKHSIFRTWVLSLCSRSAFWITSPWILCQLFKAAPDVVHLNSLVLSDFLLLLRFYRHFKKVAIVSHVREMLSPSLSGWQKFLILTCDHFVFIDKAVQMRFASAVGSSVNFDIVQNPFKGASPSVDLPAGLVVDSEKKVFAMAGRIEEGKGVLEICRAFNALSSDAAVLVIVGGGSPSCLDELASLVRIGAGRIVYLGEVKNLQETGFFGRVDFLLRGEPFFCTGRTVYEALYSGAQAILPGAEKNLDEDDILATFRACVRFYTPNDFTDLSNTIGELLKADQSYEPKNVRSNYDEYSIFLNSIYSKVAK